MNLLLRTVHLTSFFVLLLYVLCLYCIYCLLFTLFFALLLELAFLISSYVHNEGILFYSILLSTEWHLKIVVLTAESCKLDTMKKQTNFRVCRYLCPHFICIKAQVDSMIYMEVQHVIHSVRINRACII